MKILSIRLKNLASLSDEHFIDFESCKIIPLEFELLDPGGSDEHHHGVINDASIRGSETEIAHCFTFRPLAFSRPDFRVELVFFPVSRD